MKSLRQPWYLVVVEVAFLFGVLIGVSFSAQPLVHWLHEWETLVTGVFTLVAAAIGAIFLNRQIRQADEIEQKRVESRHRAIRAVLPLALSGISSYGEASASWLSDLIDACGTGDTLMGEVPAAPHPPLSEINVLKEFIEYSPECKVHLMVKLISEIQIFRARSRDVERRAPAAASIVTKHNLEGYLVDVCEIYAYTSAYYDYARFKVDFVSRSLIFVDVMRALNNVGFLGQDNHVYHDIIQRRYPTGAP